jgi:hypothetical protein
MADIDVLIQGAITLALFSYLYRENIFFRIGEHIFVGYAAGYSVAFQYVYLRDKVFIPITQGEYLNLIPFILGIAFLFFFVKDQQWVYRYPIAIVTGGGMGLAVAGAARTNFLNQIRATFVPLWTGNFIGSISNIIMVTGVIGVLWYFVFTVPQKGALAYPGKWGRWVMMVGFGVTFGLAAAARIARFIDRVADLYRYPSYYLIPVAVVLLAIGIFADSRKTRSAE